MTAYGAAARRTAHGSRSADGRLEAVNLRFILPGGPPAPRADPRAGRACHAGGRPQLPTAARRLRRPLPAAVFSCRARLRPTLRLIRRRRRRRRIRIRIRIRRRHVRVAGLLRIRVCRARAG